MDNNQKDSNIENNVFHQHQILLPGINLFSSTRNKILIVGLALFALGVICGTWFNSSFNKNYATPRTVTVIGTGTIEVPADEANIYADFIVTGKNEKDALKQGTDLINKLTNSLIGLGIPKESIKSNNYIYKNYYPSATPSALNESYTINTQKDLAYSNSFGFDVTVSNLSLVDQVKQIFEEISDVYDAGKNSRSSYYLKDSTKFNSQTRILALADARNQIEQIARINKSVPGKLISITDQINNANYGNYGDYDKRKYSTNDGKSTVDISASYKVVYELKDRSFLGISY